TKDYDKCFETCHCACYKVSSISDSSTRREILSEHSNLIRDVERILSFAANAYSEEMKSRQRVSSSEATWSSSDNDPC